VDVSEQAGLRAGRLGEHFWSTSAAFADFDGDGWPDLYICQYVNWSWQNNPTCQGYTSKVTRDVCPPKQYVAVPHALYHNRKGHFVDVTAEAGIRVDRKDKEHGKGLGVVVIDVNGDRKPDIFVANDTVDKFLYINRSTPGTIRFEELGFQMFVARDDKGVPTGSMGADAADYDGCGRPSLWCTNYENELHGLYHNEITHPDKLGFFSYATMKAGISAIGQLYVGFGTAFVDVDSDGWEDLVITNGHVIRHPVRAGIEERPVMFRNKGNGRFLVMTKRGGSYFTSEHVGRGLAVGDLDNNGKPDLVFAIVNEPVAVLRNICDNGHHWLGVQLKGKDHADYVGARLILEVDGRMLTRFAKGGGSYLSASDRRILFGLGKADRVGRLTIEWPSGERLTEHWDNLGVDRYHALEQGSGKEN
jgi:hypothetical protein